MFDRQFLPPLHAAPAVGGSVVARPAARVFAEAGTGQLVEPLVKSPPESGLERGAGSGDGPPDRPDGRRDAERRAREEAAEAALLEAEATRLIEAADAAEAGEPDEAAASQPAAAEAAGAAESGAEAPATTATVEGEEAVDLTGYGAYGKTATTAMGMSRDELVARYAHLVKYVVGRLGVSVPGLFDHEDAMQAGVLGLLRAIDAYKPEAAASFESYAILRIRGSILDAVRSLDTVGRAGREAARAIQGAIRDLQHELGRSPTEIEIAGRLNMPVARYRERLQAASVVTVSLDEHDARDNDDDSVMLADNAPDPNAVDPAEEAARRDAIASLVQEIGRLGQRSRLVLALYYQDEMTFKEIGQVLGVTESRVCQIHTEAILALRGRLVDSDVAARLRRRRARA
jgi:RNA polymerase sigma factor for flagellar operon FliA